MSHRQSLSCTSIPYRDTVGIDRKQGRVFRNARWKEEECNIFTTVFVWCLIPCTFNQHPQKQHPQGTSTMALASRTTATNHNVDCSAQPIGKSIVEAVNIMVSCCCSRRQIGGIKAFRKRGLHRSCCLLLLCMIVIGVHERRQFHSRMLIACHSTCKITCVEQCTYESVTAVVHAKLD